jgi:hypothetical protein
METYQEQRQREHREKHGEVYPDNVGVWVFGIIFGLMLLYALIHGLGEPSDYGLILFMK